MRKNFNSVLILLFVACVFSSCVKKADDPTPQSTIIGKYMTTAVTSESNGQTTSVIRSCDLDDITEFNGNGQVIENNGNIKCSTTEPATETFAYTIQSDGKNMTINGKSYFVELLSSTELKIAILTVGSTSGAVGTLRITYTRR